MKPLSNVLCLHGITYLLLIVKADVRDLLLGGDKLTEDTNEFPWVLGIFDSAIGKGKLLCGGSLLSEIWVLTSGRCVSRWNVSNDSHISVDPASIAIVAGDLSRMEDESSEQFSRVSQIIIHPNFKFDTRYVGIEEKENQKSSKGFQNDLALLRLSTPFNITPRVKPVDLGYYYFKQQGSFKIVSWGITEKRQNTIPTRIVLTQVEIPYNGEIKPKWKEKFGLSLGEDGQLVFSTGIGYNQGLMGRCIGDPGGALLCHDAKRDSRRFTVLCGVVSFGIWCDRFLPSGKFVLFTQSQIEWIESIIHPTAWKFAVGGALLFISLVILTALLYLRRNRYC